MVRGAKMKRQITEDERFALAWREVVYQSLRDLILTGEATEDEQQDARDWIFSNDASEGTFLWACGLAGVDPEDVRLEARVREAA